MIKVIVLGIFLFHALAGAGQKRIASRPHNVIKENKIILNRGMAMF